MEQVSDDREWTYYVTLNDSRSDVEASKQFLQMHDAYQLPMHLYHDHLAEVNPAKDLVQVGRSVYQANMAEDRLETNDAVTIIVGAGHAPQIRDYFELDHSNELRPVLFEAWPS